MPVDYIPLPHNVNKIAGRKSNATYDLVFAADDVPPLGFASYYVKVVQAFPAGYDEPHPIDQAVNDSMVVLSNKVRV